MIAKQFWAQIRPEGGVVHLRFSLGGTDLVRIVRGAKDATPEGPTDPAFKLVFEGRPQRAQSYPFIGRPSDTTLEAYQVWDMQAYGGFGAGNNLVDGEWSYHLWPKQGVSYGDMVSLNAESQRRVSVDLDLAIKDTLYQRVRYHAERHPLKPAVAQSEHLHMGMGIPALLVKGRHTLQNRWIGSEEPHGEGRLRTATLRAVGEILLLAADPEQRNALASYMTACLMGDFSLLQDLGWQGLNLQASDLMVDKQDAELWAHQLSLDGTIDAYILAPFPYTVTEDGTTITVEVPYER